MNNPLFSILIANYNNGKFFRDCYDSLIAQTYTNWEAIIVDDCSTDNSVEEVKKIISEDSRFKIYINEENKGCGYTKKRCGELATGEICGFVDPDDAITPEAIEIMVKTHLENENVGLVYSNLIMCDDKLNPTKVWKKKQIKNGVKNFFNINSEISHFSTFKNKYYQKTIGVNPELSRAVDQDLYLKLYEVTDVKHIDLVLYLYRIHEQGISTLENTDKAFYWFWQVIFETCKRRGVNAEELFIAQIARRTQLQKLEKEIESVNKNLFYKILNKLKLI